jgi:hypothetical protein
MIFRNLERRHIQIIRRIKPLPIIINMIPHNDYNNCKKKDNDGLHCKRLSCFKYTKKPLAIAALLLQKKCPRVYPSALINLRMVIKFIKPFKTTPAST